MEVFLFGCGVFGVARNILILMRLREVGIGRPARRPDSTRDGLADCKTVAP